MGGPCPWGSIIESGAPLPGVINTGGGGRRPLKCTLKRAHLFIHKFHELQTFSQQWVKLHGDAEHHRGRILYRRTTVAGRKIQIYGQRPLQRAASTFSGYLQDWGPCGQLYSHLRSGAPRGNYSLVNDTAFARDSD